MTDSPENPLARWSRLKRTRMADVERPGTAAHGINSKAPIPTATPRPAAADDEAPKSDLPDPETLGKDDDFAVYLKHGVPEALQRRALRALWRSDPVLANLDGLNDYDEDYRHVGTVAQAVETAWRAGRGFVDGDNADAPHDGVDGAVAGRSEANDAPPNAVPPSNEPPKDGSSDSPENRPDRKTT